MTAVDITPGPLADAYTQALTRLDDTRFVDALWGRQLDVWTRDPSTQQKIATRLGWLDALDFIAPHLPRLRALGDWVRGERFTDVVLLGMGGSSLAPEVLRQVLGVASGFPRFRMLDSVDPDAVAAALDEAATSLFVLASKSGSTIEPNVIAAEARRRIIASGEPNWGSRVIAITDENTLLHRRAVSEGFRHVFLNPADIGGRYSALSFFGMVPAALMGADVEAIVAGAREMEAACRLPTPSANPGLALGALMAAGVQHGRDKLTLLLPRRLASFGLWVEQLVAESTGKHGKGVVPITGEATAPANRADRVIVSVRLGTEAPEVPETGDGGVPVARIELRDANALGAEFLRWEIATATAGMLMDINPFDEPNVQQAKDATTKLLDAYRAHGRLPAAEPHGAISGVRLTLSAAGEQWLGGASADAFLASARPPDYVGILAYLPPDAPPFDGVLQEFRGQVAAATGCATMFGYGPRYLHSTGQLHKGGANNGVFLVITAEPSPDLPIPDEMFSFGVLEMAQAVGDFQSLGTTGRRALHVHLPRRDPDLLRRVLTTLAAR